MLKPAVHDRAQQLRLQQKVFEPGRVDADVTLFDGGRAALGAGLAARARVFLLVVDQLLLGLGHGGVGVDHG